MSDKRFDIIDISYKQIFAAYKLLLFYQLTETYIFIDFPMNSMIWIFIFTLNLTDLMIIKKKFNP